MGRPLEKAGVGLKVGWGRAPEYHQDRANNVSQIDGVSDMAPSCWLCVGRAQKRKNGLCQHICLGEHCPPALAQMPNNSVPPCMSLMPFNLLLQYWSSEEVSPSESVHGFFKRNCLRLQQFLSSTASIPSCFYSQKLWRLIFLALELCTGEPVGGLGLLTPLWGSCN